MIMCICINCQFYNKCWIKNGLNKLPKVYVTRALKLKLKTHQLNKNIFLTVMLNIFNRKHEYEFDVTQCEGFCENPGKWIS
jgi:hypothetical protein